MGRWVGRWDDVSVECVWVGGWGNVCGVCVCVRARVSVYMLYVVSVHISLGGPWRGQPPQFPGCCGQAAPTGSSSNPDVTCWKGGGLLYGGLLYGGVGPYT